MTTSRISTSPSSMHSPIPLGGLGVLLNRFVNRWIAGIIARSERQAARVALRQLDDRELKDIGIYRHQLGDAFTEIARERLRLQRRGRDG